MIKRSMFPIAALGLLASLTFATPSQAGSFLVNVSDSFVVDNPSPFNPTISSITLTFTGLTDGISDVTFLGTAYANPLAQITPTLISNAGTETVTLSFSPNVFTVSGTISFDTVTTTDSVTQLQSQINLVSETVVASANSQTYDPLHFTVLTVPEPASMSLLGIGVACLLVFRRRQKRAAVA
jgi:PEP-CTERM motif